MKKHERIINIKTKEEVIFEKSTQGCIYIYRYAKFIDKWILDVISNRGFYELYKRKT
tara:strand:+ start:507 stop:677 length:171 start_codon:yes stop_codon:yes gene_type:complete